jgi:hypothetical protein
VLDNLVELAEVEPNATAFAGNRRWRSSISSRAHWGAGNGSWDQRLEREVGFGEAEKRPFSARKNILLRADAAKPSPTFFARSWRHSAPAGPEK